MEIERKFSIKYIPKDLSTYDYKKIEQGYLCHNPVLRIRKSNEDYILTYKSKLGIEVQKKGDPIINNEVELPLTKEAYLTLKEKTDGNIIYKTRYLIPIADGLTAELDLFEDKLKGLIFAEVEFTSKEEANRFTPPDWFDKELTKDKQFSNYHLSTLSNYSEIKFDL